MASNIEHAYIHIPFCSSICSYCDFSKVLRNEEWIDSYLDSLDKEIIKRYKKGKLKTIYIGGGTPNCLSLSQLEKLFKITKKLNQKNLVEFTIECNPDLITEEQLILFKKNNINRISLGVQTFNNEYLKYLNRTHTKEKVLGIYPLIKKYFDNINIDLIYAIPNQTLEELEEDINILLKLKPTHISAYSLIIEPNTNLYINSTNNIEQDLDYEMYSLIKTKLKSYNHYEISNYSLNNNESKHNLCYWEQKDYYGFGLGAHSFIDKTRIENTRSITNYLNNNFILNSYKQSKKELMNDYLMLGLRKIEGINKVDFKNKFNEDFENVFDTKYLEKNKNNYKVSKDNLYIMNEIVLKALK